MAIERWDIDPVHSSLGFWVRHLVVAKLNGQFTRWTGVIETDTGDPRHLRVDVDIDAGSVDTREPERDAHLRSSDFFDADRHPRLTFRSTRAEGHDGERLRLVGDFTLRGVTREVVLDASYAGRVRDPMGRMRMGWSARAVIDRREFGVTWNRVLDQGGVLIGDRVELDLEVEAVRAAG